jgi:deoxyribonuclease V
MEIPKLHSWDLTPTEAVALQRKLAAEVDGRTPLTCWDLVAGADASYARFSSTIYAGVVVVRTSDGAVVEAQGAIQEATFPYIPGLLTFREVPALLLAFAKLKTEPDVIMMDGQGYSHPRRCGLASHMGLWLRRPTFGCAKTRLIGTFKDPKEKAGSLAPLQDGDDVIGSIVRTKDKTKPLYVSVGHMIDLPSAVRVVLATCKGYRLPEPARQAHHFVNELRRAGAAS